MHIPHIIKSRSRRTEFLRCVNDLLDTPDVRSMSGLGAHSETNCLEHSLYVAYLSFLVCRKFHWDFVAAARGGLLHDLFLYDRKKDDYEGKHLISHPRAALRNATRLFDLNEREKDIIVKHMWPVTLRFPRYKESFVVSTMDKLCALSECSRIYRLGHMRRKLSFA